jgi:hypothetical protein
MSPCSPAPPPLALLAPKSQPCSSPDPEDLVVVLRHPWLTRVFSRGRLPFLIAGLLLALYLWALATGEYSRR